MATLTNLVVRISGNSVALNRSLDKAQTRVGRSLAEDATRCSAACGAPWPGPLSSAALPLAGLAIAAVKSALDIEKGFAQVRTLLPEIGDAAFGALQQDVIDLSKESRHRRPMRASQRSIKHYRPACQPDNVLTLPRTGRQGCVGGAATFEQACGHHLVIP